MAKVLSGKKNKVLMYVLLLLLVASKIMIFGKVNCTKLIMLEIIYDILIVIIAIIAYRRGRALEKSLIMVKDNILDNLPYPVYYKNTAGVYIYCNCEFEKLVRLNRNSIAGRSLYEIFPKDIHNKFADSDKDLLKLGGILVNEFSMYDKDYILRKTLVCDKKNVALGIVGIILDTTEFKTVTDKLNETLKMDRIKKDFFSNISHELRTPINVMLSAIQVMNSQKEKYIVNDKYFNIINQNSYKILKLVNNLIDLTKIDAGYYNVNLINADIVKIVKDIVMSVQEYTNMKQIKLYFSTKIDKAVVACDPEKIERVVLNLLSNAIKFKKEKDAKIYVNMYSRNKDIVISVKDNGIGIEEDKLNKIFERFVQVRNKYTQKKEGSGIGLSLVKALISLHGGTVKVKSEFKKSTEFIIRIPNIMLKTENNNIEIFSSEHVKVEMSDL